MHTDDPLARFDAFAERFVAEERIPGAAVGIVRGGEPIYARGFGFRDLEAALPATPRTIFGIASLTKAFTSLALLALAEAGKLTLDDPIGRWLPEFRYPGLTPERPIRLRHLMSHTSGLPPLPALSYAIAPSQQGDPGEAYRRADPAELPPMQSLDDLLAYLASGPAPLLAPPGEVMSYQNDGYALLGEVIARADARPYDEVVTARVLAPLGMTRSTFSLAEAERLGEVTSLYARDPEGRTYLSPQWEEAPAHLATGFLKSTVEDLAEALRMYLANGRHRAFGLPPERLEQMTTPLAWNEPGAGYALGWTVQRDYRGGGAGAGVTLVRHGGGLKGVSSQLGYVPELDLGVAVLSNLEDLPVARLWLAAVNAVLGAPLDAPLLTLPGEEAGRALRERAVGSYRSLEPWGKLELELVGERLQARCGERLAEEGPVRLAPDGEFFVGLGESWRGGRLVFAADGSVRAVQFGARWLSRVRHPLPVG